MSNKPVRFMAPLLAVVGALLLLALAPGASRVAAQDDQWRARYWNNRNLTGEPVLTRDESAIDHDWGGGSPNALVNSDNFSARWNRDFDLSAGTYRFTATTDDGMRVWVDDQLVIDSWVDSQVHTLTADRTLSGGAHAIRVEYYEAGGVAVARFRFDLISTTGPTSPANWRGEYFSNMNLAGSPALTRTDGVVDFNWGLGSPASSIPADHFSARWTTTLNFNPGTYRFEVFSDDGIRIWVNDQLIIDQWRDQSDGRFAANVTLSGGATSLRVEYYENVGRAAVSLGWNPPASGPATGGGGSWRGDYFNNMSLTGSPTASRNDAVIDFTWGLGSPIAGVGVDRFSVRWTRTINFPAGTYRFDVFSDDGIRLWVNNQLLIDQWRQQSDGRFSANITLPGGNTPLRVEYFEDTGRAAVAVAWNPPVTGGGPSDQPPPITGPTATVTGTGGARLNIRNAPGGALILGEQLAPNQTVGLTGFRSADSGWVEIFKPAGGTSWISARYVTTSVPVSSLAVR